MDDVAVEVHLHVDVDGATLVPARVDGREAGDAVGVGALDAAHERARVALDAGVDAERVGVPDVDGGALDRLAGRRVDHRQGERERRAGAAFGDVASDTLVRQVVRALGHLRREHAAHRPGGDSGRPGPGVVGAPTERGGEASGEGDERAAACHPIVHARKVAGPAGSLL